RQRLRSRALGLPSFSADHVAAGHADRHVAARLAALGAAAARGRAGLAVARVQRDDLDHCAQALGFLSGLAQSRDWRFISDADERGSTRNFADGAIDVQTKFLLPVTRSVLSHLALTTSLRHGSDLIRGCSSYPECSIRIDP